MDKFPYIFKLEIIGGLALIQKEVACDYYVVEDETYFFKARNTDYCDGIIARYPVVNTIIHSVDENDRYVDPEVEAIPEVRAPRIDLDDLAGFDNSAFHSSEF